MLLHLICYGFLMTTRNPDVMKVIWVPPVEFSILGTFGLSLNSTKSVIAAKMYVRTTFFSHETRLLRNSAVGILISFSICSLMSYEKGVHVVMLFQNLLLVVGLFENIVISKYLLGIRFSRPYAEFYKQPTDAMIQEDDTIGGVIPMSSSVDQSKQEEKSVNTVVNDIKDKKSQ